MSNILVQEYKYAGQKHYSYPATLLSESPELVIIYGAYGRPLTHPGRGLTNVPIDNHSIEFHFKDRPYNVSAGFYADGRFRGYYCNVTTPATLTDGLLSSVDLDLDLVVSADLAYQVEDEDEFEEHRVAYNYPEDVVAMARAGLAELIRLVEARAYPFDGTAQALFKGLTERASTL